MLIVNKLDRDILEKQLNPEDVYRSLCRTTESTNIVSTYLTLWIKKSVELFFHDLNQLCIERQGEECEKTGKDLILNIMPKRLPLGPTMLEMVARHLPSPLEAQMYRTRMSTKVLSTRRGHDATGDG